MADVSQQTLADTNKKNSFNQSQQKNLVNVNQTIVSTDVGQKISTTDIGKKKLFVVGRKNPNQRQPKNSHGWRWSKNP